MFYLKYQYQVHRPKVANPPTHTQGLTLSGADSKDDCAAFKKHLLDKSPSLGRHLEVRCDTDGSIATVSPEGGWWLL